MGTIKVLVLILGGIGLLICLIKHYAKEAEFDVAIKKWTAMREREEVAASIKRHKHNKKIDKIREKVKKRARRVCPAGFRGL